MDGVAGALFLYLFPQTNTQASRKQKCNFNLHLHLAYLLNSFHTLKTFSCCFIPELGPSRLSALSQWAPDTDKLVYRWGGHPFKNQRPLAVDGRRSFATFWRFVSSSDTTTTRCFCPSWKWSVFHLEVKQQIKRGGGGRRFCPLMAVVHTNISLVSWENWDLHPPDCT